MNFLPPPNFRVSSAHVRLWHCWVALMMKVDTVEKGVNRVPLCKFLEFQDSFSVAHLLRLRFLSSPATNRLTLARLSYSYNTVSLPIKWE